MAAPSKGIGYRTACDVLMEVSFHLLQPTVFTQIVSIATSGGGGYGAGGYGAGGYGGGTGYTIQVQSTNAMYAGALVVVGWNLPTAEVAIVASVIDGTHFTTTLVNNHLAGESIIGPTFPIQESTDPIFTQDEMLGYLARAQNEFLTSVPCYYQRFFQDVNMGGIYQDTPSTAVLIDRIAASSLNLPITSLSRVSNVVTLVSEVPHGLTRYSTFAVSNSNANPPPAISDQGFLGGAFSVISVPDPATVTYFQIGPDVLATGGVMTSMLRLYETTQQELTMQDRYWQSNYTAPLRTWFEDRTGLYKWGVGGQPSTTFPVELLCAVRDTDTLALLDQFLVPDMCLHAVKYLTLAYAWSKDGVQQQPAMADFAMRRYTQIVLATQRYIAQMKMETGQQ